MLACHTTVLQAPQIDTKYNNETTSTGGVLPSCTRVLVLQYAILLYCTYYLLKLPTAQIPNVTFFLTQAELAAEQKAKEEALAAAKAAEAKRKRERKRQQDKAGATSTDPGIGWYSVVKPKRKKSETRNAISVF